MEKMSIYDKGAKRLQISFRIGVLAEERLQQVAELFNMKPSAYVKSMLYRELQIFNESTDMRRRSKRRKTRAI
jgi:hypothetical protein